MVDVSLSNALIFLHNSAIALMIKVERCQDPQLRYIRYGSGEFRQNQKKVNF